jgi:N-carbamoylputrescine amidase
MPNKIQNSSHSIERRCRKQQKKCLSWVRDAANQGAEVITLPELYSSHYFCQSEDVDNFAFAEPLYSTSFIAFSALAKELGVVIIVPFFEKKNGWHLS